MASGGAGSRKVWGQDWEPATLRRRGFLRELSLVRLGWGQKSKHGGQQGHVEPSAGPTLVLIYVIPGHAGLHP